MEKLSKARENKLKKREDVAHELRRQGFDVFNGAIVIGSLGSFDEHNFKSMAALGIPHKVGTPLAKKLIGQTIDIRKIIIFIIDIFNNI